jgi:hypothetical protein
MPGYGQARDGQDDAGDEVRAPGLLPAKGQTVTARSLTWSVEVAARAQWAQQKNLPSTSAPWPITRHPQCSQTGAIAWIAHSKLSKTCRAPAALTSNALS